MNLLVGTKKSYLVGEGNDLHCNQGHVKAEAISEAGVGGKVRSNKDAVFNVVEPDILDFIRKAKRGPQAVTLKDMGLIAAYAGISSESRVVEAGTGSGLLSMYLAHILAPGRLVTYEVREDFAQIALKNFERFGVDNIKLKQADIYEGIEEKGLDAVILDLPEPWTVTPHLSESLKVGGRAVSYSPSVNQVHKFNDSLEGYEVESFECIQRHWKPKTMRPDTRMIGHTGFLTVARRLE